MMLRIEFPDGRTTIRDLDTFNHYLNLSQPDQLLLTTEEGLIIASLFKSLRACSKLLELKNLENSGFTNLYN
jgi:hypothetical protein